MCRCAKLVGALGGAALVTACTIPPPSGPTVMAIPPPGKDLAVFQQEDGQCQNYAAAMIGALPIGQAGPQPGAGGGIGPASEATAGSASGVASGNASAAAGGAPGYMGDVAAGATYAAASAYNVQTRYNIAYTQCTCASGNAVLPMPPSVYGYYANAGGNYPWYGDPWFEWGGLGLAGGGVFVFDRDHFHHGYHGGSHEGFHGGSRGGGMHGGGHGRG